MAHTPGPWRVSTNTASFSICNQGTYTVATVKRTKYVEQARETEMANARLIAAAPELYEALRGLCDALPSAEEMLAEGREEGPYLKLMRAALAKAEGR